MKKESRISQLDEKGKITQIHIKYDKSDNYSSSETSIIIRNSEHDKLKRFASKITKIPETVRMYSNPLTGKEREKK